VIGGRLLGADANARLGAGRYLVAEADESDASFLHLQPMIAVITNIDADHLSAYEGDLSRLKQAFLDFTHNLPFYGLAIMCSDDEPTRELIPQVERRVISYGFGERSDVRASGFESDGLQTRFRVEHPEFSGALAVCLNLPGRHNVLNALAAICAGVELRVDHGSIQAALEQFSGIDRRLQVLGEVETAAGQITFVDDYGHHPTEIAATLSAARSAWPGRRIVVVFQPHRYSRTHDLIDDFAAVLAGCDVLVLTAVYPAGEEPITGADGKALARAVRARGAVEPVYVEELDELPRALASLLKSGDLVLTLGAGSIGAAARTLPARLAAPSLVGAKA
jgi:UDP-N-acetylmuramate--alanine ligase